MDRATACKFSGSKVSAETNPTPLPKSSSGGPSLAHLIGEPGHGIRTGISINHFTRLDFAVESSGLMRQAVAQAATMLVVAFRTESGRGQRLLTLLGRADTAPRRVTIWPTPQTAAEPF